MLGIYALKAMNIKAWTVTFLAALSSDTAICGQRGGLDQTGRTSGSLIEGLVRLGSAKQAVTQGTFAERD